MQIFSHFKVEFSKTNWEKENIAFFAFYWVALNRPRNDKNIVSRTNKLQKVWQFGENSVTLHL